MKTDTDAETDITTTAVLAKRNGNERPGGAKLGRCGNLRLLSPRGLVARALLLAAVYVACELAGWREATTFLSGSQTGSSWSATVWKGVAFLLAYHGAVLLAPILLIAAGLLAAWGRFGTARLVA